MAKFRTALIFAAAGLVLTFLFTVGKVIEGGALAGRYLVNVAVFFGLGFGLDFVWKKYLLPLANRPEEKPDGLSEILSPDRTAGDKGRRFDLTVDGPAETTGQTTGSGNPPVEAVAEVAAKPNPLGPHKDFEIHDDFIIINDKKVPNDPKLMAAAIKTKLSGE